WTGELQKFCPLFCVHLYYGDYRTNSNTNVGATARNKSTIDRSDAVFKVTEEDDKVILLTSYTTLQSRYGPHGLNAYREKDRWP
ncbi:hypothetical protein LTR66_015296, partial [Elasticomyces elasticus]